MAGPGMDLRFLTRRHAIKIASNASVETCSLAIGEVVGHENVLSASRMNNAVVCFLKSVDMANDIVENGLVINGEYMSVLPLSTPSKKVILSNVPPFISDEVLCDTLSRYGKIVSPIRKIAIASKSPLLKHVVSFRRSVYMICREELDLKLSIKVNDFNYGIYVTTDTMKCLGCGEPGHFLRACPKNQGDSDKNDTVNLANGGTDESVVAETSGVGRGEQDKADVSSERDEEKNNVDDVTVEPSVTVTSGLENGAQLSGERTNYDLEEMNIGGEDSTDAEKHMSSQRSVRSLPVGEVSYTVGNMRSTEPNDVPFKEPPKAAKRKSTRKSSSKAKKNELASNRNDTESESEFSDCSVTCSLQPSGYAGKSYSVDDIKSFLVKTKHARHVSVDQYFPDVELFINQTKTFMGHGNFTDQEVFRLKKILTKLNLLLNDGKNPDDV
ncbi:hypothetical protein ACEWY4_024400 [Coilia grayii]|uniref:CCHC-type domain-containing protein n=1 Tax=Coilia grayii TaxID=363190 RepID=A0ABD1J0K9_9TELE